MSRADVDRLLMKAPQASLLIKSKGHALSGVAFSESDYFEPAKTLSTGVISTLEMLSFKLPIS